MIRYFLNSYVLWAILILSTFINCSLLFAKEPDVPVIELTVLISPSDHSLRGHALITVPQGTSAQFVQGGITLEAAKTMDGPVMLSDESSVNEYLSDVNKARRFEISYSVSYVIPETTSPGSDYPENVIDPSGTILLSGWHPALSVPSIYTLIAEVPVDHEALSEAESIRTEDRDDVRLFHFAYLYPRKTVSLVAAKYVINTEIYNDTEIATYFLSNSESLSKRYLSAAKRFHTLYRSMLDSVPYKRFAIVESPLASVRSFPTYVIINSDLLHEQSTSEVPLGRAFLRQWFGNRLYVDPSSGDWAEGLITYLADYWIENLSNEGADFRKRLLVLYRNLVNDENEFSLSEFAGQSSPAAKAIGSGKGAMVFHMLRMMIGEGSFFKGLKELIATHDFQPVSWDSICKTLTGSDGMDIKNFCDHWIKKPGIPTISLKEAYPVFRGETYFLELNIARSGNEAPLSIPVEITLPDRQEAFSAALEEGQSSLSDGKPLDAYPSNIAVDAGYDIFRSPGQAEIPPVFSRFAGNTSNIVITSEKADDGTSGIIALLKEKGFVIKGEKEVTTDDLSKHSFLLFSDDDPLYNRLFAGKPLPDGNVLFKVEENPLNSREVVVILGSAARANLYRFLDPWKYGYSSLLLKDPDGIVHSYTSLSHKGIRAELEIPVSAINTRKTLALDPIIDQINQERVICIGENHTEYSHHIMQFDIIKRLHESGRKLIIGMEMFQRPFQDYLDRYIDGELDEKEFLERTEYFKRWAYNYNLYRDILNFARSEQIPVKALNLRKEIIDKVSKSGIDSLSDEEFSEIPQLLDMTNREYRTFLRGIFFQHAKSAKRQFDNFFQSQILWDETMALSAAEALKQNPDATVILLAGNGHLQNSWGIPDRIKRHTGIKPVVILNGGTNSIESGLADYLLFPGHAEVPEPPLLMVSLKVEDDRISVENVMKGGPADMAGILKGDVLSTIEGREIKSLQDIKSILFWKKAGDKVSLSLERKRFLFGSRELGVTVTLR